MSIYEYDEEKHMQQERQQYLQEGREEGREEGRKEGRKEERLEMGKRVFQNMITQNYSREEAQKISELTDEQVKAILQEQVQ